jgi:hypothetical protein
MDQQRTTTTGENRSWLIFFALAGYLIANFLYRTLTAAHEYPMRTEQVMTIGFDVLALIGLYGLRAHGPKPLFWIALTAGLGLLAIRVNGDASWWTGHLVFSIPRR